MLQMLKNDTSPDLHITSPDLHVKFFFLILLSLFFPAFSCIKILDIYFFYLLPLQ